MNADAKKTALRMIPYGIYVLTAETADGVAAAATVNWVTQTSVAPPLIAEESDIDEMCDLIDASLHAALNRVRGK